MSWFGWLTKGKCEISVLDVLTFFTEGALIVLVLIFVNILYRSWRKILKEK